MCDNFMKIQFASKSENEGFARVAVAAFVSQLDPTLDEITDVKTAISEAVTNAIIHGYGNDKGTVSIEATLGKDKVIITVADNGMGIDDLEQAMQPLYTSRPDLERSGMGFTVMESFMDSLQVESKRNVGTKVVMEKVFKSIRQVE